MIYEEFNTLIDKISAPDFFAGKGLGNELAFFIYDYAPKDELEVRNQIPNFIHKIENKLCKKVLHIDLLELLYEFLTTQLSGIDLDTIYDVQKNEGNNGLIEAFRGCANEGHLSEFIETKTNDQNPDLILMTGVGKVYPILRAHNLLNNLHARLGFKPLIMFYPGEYDKQTLRLFNEVFDDNYYRAFRLIDRKEY